MIRRSSSYHTDLAPFKIARHQQTDSSDVEMEFGKDDDDDDDHDDDHYYRFDINEKITSFVSAEEQVDPKTVYR